jgi:myosin heavy subunit
MDASRHIGVVANPTMSLRLFMDDESMTTTVLMERLGLLSKTERHLKVDAINKTTFNLCHWKGTVEYDVREWLPLNRNGISKSLVFGDAHVATMLAAPSVPEKTVVSQQVALVHTLIGTLCDAHPHFVHCIVATSAKCDEFSGSAVLEQVTQMGILESARMYRKGYAEHATHHEFVERYRPLIQSMGLDTSGGNDTAIASALVSALKMESGLWDEILIGKFRVMVKAIHRPF